MKIKIVITVRILFFFFHNSFGQKSKGKKLNDLRFEQDTIQGVYIPTNLEDCFDQINSFWDDSVKTKVKALEESEFSTNAHFGLGQWMRNNWQLWGGSRLSKYFHDLGIFHPDDMSAIILDSYHRHLNGREIKLEEQVEWYKNYWKVNAEPLKKEYPKGVKKLELNKTLSYNLNGDKKPGCVHVQTNSKNDQVWIYDYYYGWLQISKQKLKALEQDDQLEEVVKELFDKR